MHHEHAYKHLQESADYVLHRIAQKPEVGIILGSSLGGLVDKLEDRVHLPYKEIPHMPLSTAPGHAGELVFGNLSGKFIVAMSGRFHYYEGYTYEELAQPVRLLKLLGIKSLIISNAAGCVNTDWQVGDIMVIQDHINFAGASPMRGMNIEEFGERFFDVSNMYNKDLQELALAAAEELGQSERTKHGVYFFMTGPHYETPAEIRAIRILGGDAVGMSTVTEALTAAHVGIPVLGLSLLTNMAAGISKQDLSTEEVERAATQYGERFQALVSKIIEKL